MIRRPDRFLKQLVFLIDLAVVGIAFLSAYVFRNVYLLSQPSGLHAESQIFEPLQPLDQYLWLLLIALPLWTGLLHGMGGYRELRVKSVLEMAWIIFKVSGLALLIFGSVVYMVKLMDVSRSFMIIFFLVGALFLSIERGILIFCSHMMLRRGYFHRNLLIVGTGRRAQQFVKAVNSHADWGLKIIGFLDEDGPSGQLPDGLKVIGKLSDLKKILQNRVVDEVIFVVPRNWMTKIEPAILQCELAGIRATVAVDMFNIKFAKVQPTDFDGFPLVSFDTAPVSQWQMAAKRVVDVVVSGLGLLVLLPLFLLAVLLIKASSDGPIFFRQIRCGLNGRQFNLYKLRSMVVGAELRQKELESLNEMGGPVFKMEKDPRLTPIGRLLRKTSIDELPQLYNVFKGEMSLVGPRPPIPAEVKKYEDWHRRRLSMRPGITGLWQVSGRNKIKDFNKWMELDLEYIDRWSPLLDTRILFKTVPVVLFGIGAK